MSRVGDLVGGIARALADDPDAVRVVGAEHRGVSVVEVYMAEGDLGRVIGRQGRTARRRADAGRRGGRAGRAARAGRVPRRAAARRHDGRTGTRLITVGRIARPHGLRGHVVVNLETDFPEQRYRPGAELWVQRGGAPEALRIAEARFHQRAPGRRGSRASTRIEAAEALGRGELRADAGGVRAAARRARTATATWSGATW